VQLEITEFWRESATSKEGTCTLLIFYPKIDRNIPQVEEFLIIFEEFDSRKIINIELDLL